MPYIKTNPLTIAGTVKPDNDYIYYRKTIPTAKYLKWDAKTETIVEDPEAEQAELDGIAEVKQLDVILAMEALGESEKLDALLASGYEKYWNAAGGVIDLNHPLTQQALAAADINVDAIKSKIMEMNA